LRVTNFSVLASHKRILPAMHALLQSAAVKVHGFLCPGHVSVIIGWRAYEPIVRMYRLPCVIAGFEDVQIVAALARLTELVAAAFPALENQYPQAVSAEGNAAAQRVIEQVFRPADVTWRGLGELPDSGLAIRDPFKAFDAAERYQLPVLDSPEPAGCRCGEVITARCTPPDCALFGRACTPINPIGPCMVSSEGTCQAWFKYRRCAVEVR
jgi:hydrogenase expression/formation protein HypD